MNDESWILFRVVTMGIKMRDSLHRTVKTAEGLQSIGEKAGEEIGELKRQAAEAQNPGCESEQAYAGNHVQDSSERLTRVVTFTADTAGRWGIRQTARNLRRIKSRQFQVKTAEPKLLPPLTRLASPYPSSAKPVRKSAEKTAEAVKRVVKANVKMANRTGKAVAAAVKATASTVKNVTALLIAGGWLAVVIILLLCIAGCLVCAVENGLVTIS